MDVVIFRSVGMLGMLSEVMRTDNESPDKQTQNIERYFEKE